MLEVRSCRSGIGAKALVLTVMTMAVGGSAHGQSGQHAEKLAGYWTTDIQWSSEIRSASRPGYFWVGRMWGRFDATGKLQFQADNGCVATGLMTPYGGGTIWSGAANIKECKTSNLNGRYSVSVSGGQGTAPLSLRLNAHRHNTGGIDSYVAWGAFARYRP